MDEREILVDVDRAALESRGLTLDQIRLALGAENLNVPAGNLVERHSEVLVRTMGEFKGLDDIRRTVVGMTAAGEPVYVSDVAEVKDTLKEMRYTRASRARTAFTSSSASGPGPTRDRQRGGQKGDRGPQGHDPRQHPSSTSPWTRAI